MLQAAVRRRVGAGRSLYAGTTYAIQSQRMVEVEPGGQLAPGTVPGSTGGRAAMLGLEVLHDTRLAVYGPRAGHLVRASAGYGGSAVGSEFEFQRYTVDARYYRGLGGATVEAAQALVDVVDGTVPFDRLPKLGGQTILRGYTEPRYRDDAMAGDVDRDVLRQQLGAVGRGGEGDLLAVRGHHRLDPLQGPGSSTNMLTNADFKFRPAKDSRGRSIEVTQGTMSNLMHNPDRTVRRTSYESYMDLYLEHKNTLATNLAHSIKANVFYMRARRHESSLPASLFDLNVPTEVFHNLIDTFKSKLPIWHRYFEIRRKALGLKKLAYYDMWAPITRKKVKVPFERGVELICESLAPLGREYVNSVRRGILRDRWVDVYPNRGKAEGAFSSGTQGTHPFINMSYTDEVSSMSTLAHELGHSMHSYYTNANQRFLSSWYGLFVTAYGGR